MTVMPAKMEAPITVFIHVHYLDIWREMSALLAKRLALPFHLVLTSSQPREEIVPPCSPWLLSTRFLLLENRGRDVLPFLRAMTETNDFEFGLKLHTKKSPQREDGAEWRAEILDSLLPPVPGTSKIVARMRADRRVGLVTPAGYCLSVRSWTFGNIRSMRRAMSALGVDLVDSALDDTYFGAGSMFWFRRSAVAMLADRISPELFEAEDGQLDGTTAHAIERLFPVEARRQGYLSLAVPALMSSQPEMPLAELLELARRHADIPSRNFLTPSKLAVPPALPGLIGALGPLYRRSLPLGLRRLLRQVLRR
jgi:lipopolysaccharide biosynthesis protein